MKEDLNLEQRFITEVDSFEFAAQDIDHVLHALDRWLTHLDNGLRAAQLTTDGLVEHNPLARQARAINVALEDCTHAWPRHWADREGARTLAEALDDKVLLLVFGKFNAGKSSFCNVLAERFVEHGRPVQFFYLDAGHIVDTGERFAEGPTETTTRLQGVQLGKKLVLLDTPGLHSITPENAALTQRFTDSADAVLWLTSSTSPGQVQELDELSRELHRGKPVLPVVTRSDLYDEDEIDGVIRKFLRNKTADDRAEQEADISARAREKFVAMEIDPTLLKTPVSISSYMARERTPVAVYDAGFERLYAALLELAEPALAYRGRKQAEVLLHHLEENVLGTLMRDLLPSLDELQALALSSVNLLERQRMQVTDATWSNVMPTVPALLETHTATGDVGAVCHALSRLVFDAFVCDAKERFTDYVIVWDAALAQIDVDGEARFEDIAIERSEEQGSLREIVGVDYQRLYTAMGVAAREAALRLSGDAAGQCGNAIKALMTQAAHMREVVQTQKQVLIELKLKLRAGFREFGSWVQ